MVEQNFTKQKWQWTRGPVVRYDTVKTISCARKKGDRVITGTIIPGIWAENVKRFHPAGRSIHTPIQPPPNPPTVKYLASH